jgi:hypothetical protein
VELAGLYHHSTIDATWRDLHNRYPFYMEGRSLQPQLKGRIEEDDEGQQSWYQLYIASFNSQGEAEEYCPHPESRSATLSGGLPGDGRHASGQCAFPAPWY